MSILVIAEHDNQQLKLATHHTISAAKQLGDDIHVLIMGYQCQSVADHAKEIDHVQKILLVDHDVYQHQLAENCAALVAELGKNYQYILSGSTTFGKNLLPRAAALLDAALISDVAQIISANTFVRPLYAGNIMATVECDEPLKLLTIRTTVFPAANTSAAHQAPIEKINQAIPNTLSRFENQSLTQSTRPELTNARVIISGGRGLKSADNFKLLETIADKLGAAIGASRAAVDAGFAPNDYQVGQTGKIVAPDLYIAVGISGAIQHLAGMKDSKIIVAINNDPDAAIFEMSDYGLVGDLFKILPELEDQLN